MSGNTILVVEDEEDILNMIKYNLQKEGYDVVATSSGEEGLKMVEKHSPDLIILDIMLPGMDGLVFCRRIRYSQEFRKVPIIMLTARTDEVDIVTGLEVGADDYVTKPFSPRVLVARIRVLLRRNEEAEAAATKEEVEEDVLEIHDLCIFPRRLEAKLHGKLLELTHSEFTTLHFLAKNPGWVFSRQEIVDNIHGENYPVTERAVDVLIVGLRKKLGDCSGYIQTVRGAGYRFKQ